MNFPDKSLFYLLASHTFGIIYLGILAKYTLLTSLRYLFDGQHMLHVNLYFVDVCKSTSCLLLVSKPNEGYLHIKRNRIAKHTQTMSWH